MDIYAGYPFWIQLWRSSVKFWKLWLKKIYVTKINNNVMGLYIMLQKSYVDYVTRTV